LAEQLVLEEIAVDKGALWTCQHVRLKQCRDGALIYNINDFFAGRGLDKYGEVGHGTVRFLSQLIRPGMTILEVGANIGIFTLPLARFVRPGGKVIAFEPQRIIYQMLCGNIALNAIDNIIAHNSAVGCATGSITVPPVEYAQPGNFGGVSMATAGAGEIVPLVTIDSLALPECDFIKIDVEGMELDVLEGARTAFNNFALGFS
jgi:FkbM family methyltransferase